LASDFWLEASLQVRQMRLQILQVYWRQVKEFAGFSWR
jgi:hypothetical protein